MNTTPIGDAALVEAITTKYPGALPCMLTEAVESARRKLGLINSRAGRSYGEDGYGDKYLLKLAVEAYEEMAYQLSINDLAVRIMNARKGFKDDPIYHD